MVNRLAQSQSLYLRKHAENPIDWWPWCDEALETARSQNKPIFLSIGYSSCHWCTVMEGEAFSDRAIAEYMNSQFVPIKVDREERPDIDSIYMQALQMMTGQGGWPLNVFLTPDERIPFYGGTYFPVTPRYGRPGFLEVLQSIRRFYYTEKRKLQAFKGEILDNLHQSVLLTAATAELNREIFQKGLELNTGIIAGSNPGPSFPMMPYAELALRGTRFNFDAKYDSKQVCTQRGLDLALGGIYDHVAGGFHRYTVDATWTVPHFEKMLYDNGQIVEYLANLWSAGIEEPAFASAIARTVEWLKREMTAPSGYFYAAQDADSFTPPTPPYQGGATGGSEPEEGAFYVWTYTELQTLLTVQEFAEIQEQFDVSRSGNFEGKNVLQRRHPGKLSETVEMALAKLFAVRYGGSPDTVEIFPPARNNQEAKNDSWPGRIPAVTDTKMIAAWNSLMISGLARAAAVFGNFEYLELAVKAANFILDNQWIDGRFQRLNYDGQSAVAAQSEDYALFVKALLDLHQGSLMLGNAEAAQQLPSSQFWLEKAVRVQDEFDEFLWSVELGGYYNTAKDASGDLLVRERSYTDNATPAANGVAIASLVRLALLGQNLEYLDRAQQALQAFSSIVRDSPQACPSLLSALDWYHHSTLVRTSPDQISGLISRYSPTAVCQIETDLPEGVIGLVCECLTCKEPAKNLEMLLAEILHSQTRV
ncbi:MAG: thioredoxin domain-containing protein [Microcoleus sp. PH2017_22_RUC_O_B]|uniref:thioredoxin domain-containing protein n=1 Tax=unclassified Microcoleus TaxID=2642155 RepID=UPI001D60DCAF|nr:MULTISPECIES: thioredoxin domain-containing protein [unclassified Microcoleus]MCC3526988.1 thioredoxin domain-containing protein [Microcoleus sp. PH2017_21_RUC_O_A]MCC3540363.1 thioredoxin domain-containing protein [Microcoleus sp. PH2017_22_RUC_O_B]